MNLNVFTPKSNTFVIAATTSAPSGIQITPFENERSTQYGHYRIVNPGSNNVTLGWGSSATDAQSNAVAATSGAGNDTKSIEIFASSIEVIRLPAGVYLSGLAGAANDIYVTLGEGI